MSTSSVQYSSPSGYQTPRSPSSFEQPNLLLPAFPTIPATQSRENNCGTYYPTFDSDLQSRSLYLRSILEEKKKKRLSLSRKPSPTSLTSDHRILNTSYKSNVPLSELPRFLDPFSTLSASFDANPSVFELAPSSKTPTLKSSSSTMRSIPWRIRSDTDLDQEPSDKKGPSIAIKNPASALNFFENASTMQVTSYPASLMLQARGASTSMSRRSLLNRMERASSYPTPSLTAKYTVLSQYRRQPTVSPFNCEKNTLKTIRLGDHVICNQRQRKAKLNKRRGRR